MCMVYGCCVGPVYYFMWVVYVIWCNKVLTLGIWLLTWDTYGGLLPFWLLVNCVGNELLWFAGFECWLWV